jgi:hypothetical protein
MVISKTGDACTARHCGVYPASCQWHQWAVFRNILLPADTLPFDGRENPKSRVYRRSELTTAHFQPGRP